MRLFTLFLLLILAAPAWAQLPGEIGLRGLQGAYVDIYAVTGVTYSEHQVMSKQGPVPGEFYWSQSRFVGAKVVGRLPLGDFALVGRAQVRGLPGTFVYNEPSTFTAIRRHRDRGGVRRPPP